MKKIFTTIAICGVLFASNVNAQKEIHLFIDGVEKQADIILKDDRTFVPIRFISESMDYKVDYDAKTRGVKISKGNESMDLTIGSKEFVKDGKEGQMDVEAFVSNDRTFVPLRFIGEAFSKDVGWHQDSRSVYIGEKPSEFPKPDTSGYTVKDYPKFGVRFYLPKDFDKKILIRENKESNSLEFHSKFVDEYKRGGGFLKTFRLGSMEEGYDYELGEKVVIDGNDKILIESPSLDFGVEGKKYYDDMMVCFDIADKVIIVPLENVFPDAKNMSTSIENGNFVCKFGRPQVTASMPLDKLKGIRLQVGGSFISFYDIKNNKQLMGGYILSLTQNQDGYVLTKDVSGSVLLKEGNSVTEITGPTDVQYDDRKEFKNSYNQSKKTIIDNLNIKIGDKNYKVKNF